MAKTNAENQAAYKKRQLQDADGSAVRLDLLVDTYSKTSLKRLASHYRVSQRVMVEMLILEAQKSLLATFSSDQQEAFYKSVD